MKYVKAKSWHIYKFTTRGGLHKARCGLYLKADSDFTNELPMTEKSCESCLRYNAIDEAK